MTGSDTDGTGFPGAAADAPADLSTAGADRAGASGPWQLQLSTLGSFIRAQRRLADLSLREMAAITKISNAYLSQVERGLHQPSLKVLQAIGEALGISSQDLLSHAGFAEAAANGATGQPGTEQAILADPRLSEEQKAALVAVYRGFIAGTTPPARGDDRS